MNSEEIVLSALRSLGRADALALRARAAGMDGTALIAEEARAPVWDPARDYSGWPTGAPVVFQEQVYRLFQPHDAAHHPEATPENTPALWSIAHTTDPARAKPWAAPNGTSGLYIAGECARWEDGKVYRCTKDGTVHSPGELPDAWKICEKEI